MMRNASYYRELKNSRVCHNSILKTFDGILHKVVYDHAYDMFASGPVIYEEYLKDIETPNGSIDYLISTYNIIIDDIVNMLKDKLINLGFSNIKINFNKDKDDRRLIHIEFDY